MYDPRVRQVSFFSPILGIQKSFSIYIPPDLPEQQQAPSLYLLRGHEREWINPIEDATRGRRNVIDVYERLRRAGLIGPIILIFPSLASDDNRVPGLLVNMRAPELSREVVGIGSGRFQDFFFQDLIPYVDRHFPTIADRRQRGIAGFSLGGAMAIMAAALLPTYFATAASYDGTFLYAIDRGRLVRASDTVLHNPVFDPAYGLPRDLQFVANNSASNLILRGDIAALSSVIWMIAYGPEQREPGQANFYRGEHLVHCLRVRGLDNALPFGVWPDGDHTWRTADRFVELTLPLHDRVFRSSMTPISQI